MDVIRDFLESSTIHGLNFLSKTRSNVKIFWVLVVVTGFSGAGIIIYQSFQDWHENPVTTTLETRPITEITFPKVTVCPPKDTFTDLNYDLMRTENMTLDNETRNELTIYALELLYDKLYDTIMSNLSRLEENDRYYNWYHGYTDITLPTKYEIVGYRLTTYALSGNISTKYFGQRFDAEKVEMDISYVIYITPPEKIQNATNATLHISIEKVSLTELSRGWDLFSIYWYDEVDPKGRYVYKNFTPPGKTSKYTNLYRKRLKVADLEKQDITEMPGFRITWYYSGIGEKQVDHQPEDSDFTKLFVRNRH